MTYGILEMITEIVLFIIKFTIIAIPFIALWACCCIENEDDRYHELKHGKCSCL